MFESFGSGIFGPTQRPILLEIAVGFKTKVSPKWTACKTSCCWFPSTLPLKNHLSSRYTIHIDGTWWWYAMFEPFAFGFLCTQSCKIPRIRNQHVWKGNVSEAFYYGLCLDVDVSADRSNLWRASCWLHHVNYTHLFVGVICTLHKTNSKYPLKMGKVASFCPKRTESYSNHPFFAVSLGRSATVDERSISSSCLVTQNEFSFQSGAGCSWISTESHIAFRPEIQDRYPKYPKIRAFERRCIFQTIVFWMFF